MGKGRWEMGDRRWEKGDGRSEMGDRRWDLVLSFNFQRKSAGLSAYICGKK